MRNNKSSGIITSKLPNKISFIQKNTSKKKIKLQVSNKLRNKSTNLVAFKSNYLPNINTSNDTNNILDEKLKENKNFKNSFSSTFYTTSSNIQNTLYDNSNKKISKKNRMLNQKQFIILNPLLSSKNKKKLEMNPNFFYTNKLKKNENLDLYKDAKDNIITKENDYSLIIKKLDRWDKDNCFVKQYDKFSLYHVLNNYYQKKGLSEDLKNLNTMDSLLKSKTNYDQLIQNRLNYKNSKIATEVISNLKKSTNNNLKYSHMITSSNLNKSIKIKDIDYEDNKLLSEKIKYESQLHNDLVFVNNIIYNKKCLKQEILKKLEEIYKENSDLKYEYDKKYNSLVKDYWQLYDEYDQRYKKLEELFIQQSKKDKNEKKENKESKDDTKDNKKDIKNKNKENKEENNNEETKNENETDNNIDDKNKDDDNKKEQKEEINSKEEEKQEGNTNKLFKRSTSKKYSVKRGEFIKEMNFIKNTKLKSINLILKENIDKIQSEYKDKFKNISKQKKDMEEQIKIISNELNYYKQVNEELIREHRTYYMNMLKKGTDYRKEGLVWIVKNLLELQINLEYQHFPKFLTHEHIDYLIKLANLLLEQSELVIIIKVLRKKQTTSYMDDNVQTYNMLDKYMENHFKGKNGIITNFLSGNIQQKLGVNYNKKMINVIQEIDKKFYNVYKNNKEIMKNYLEKNEEELKLRNALNHIKKGLYNSDNFIKDNQTSILDAFMCNTKNKDFFSFILKIKNRLNQLDEIIDNLIKNEKDFYIEQIKKINNSNSTNFDNTFNNNYNKDIIKRSLFGEKCDF